MIRVVLIISLFFGFVHAQMNSYQVAFETVDCDGETGFATIAIEKIDKIKSASCSYEGKKLKKLLVNHKGSYITYTLTYEEAKNVMEDVKLYNRMRLKMMENADTLIIKK